MKKLKKLFTILIALLLPFSCIDADQASKDPKASFKGIYLPSNVNAAALPPPGSLPDMTAFNALMQNQVALIFHQNDNYIYKVNSYLFFNYERFERNQVQSFNNAFSSQNLNVVTFSDGFQFPNSVPTTLTKPSQVANVSTIYNSTQLTILDNFTTTMYNATTHTHYLNAALTAAQATGNSSLTSQEKFEVMAFVNTGVIFAEDFFNGDSNFLKTVIQEESGENPSLNCKVNFRGVWAGAVVGGVVGGVRGVMVGAAGGTMTFPGLGTVGGAVGGGVIGFATGFIGGAATGVVTELLTSCFRQSYLIHPIVHPSQCDEQHEILNDICREPLDRKIIAVHL